MFVCTKGVEVADGWTSRLFACPVAVSEAALTSNFWRANLAVAQATDH